MPRYEVQLVESRDLVFEVDADNPEEAAEIAMDLDACDAKRDSFRSRELDWTLRA